MTIKLGTFFKHEYKANGFNRNNAYLYCMNTIDRYDVDVQGKVFNILKVADTINSDYVEVALKIFEAMPDVGVDDYSVLQQKKKDVVAITLVYLQETRHSEVNKYIRPRRNIEFEIAADLYGESVDSFYAHNRTLKDSNVLQKVAKMKEIGLGYNIEKEPNVSWDEHYFGVCLSVARNSKCMSRKIGAILVREKRIISTGYNGPPEGLPTCDYRWTLDKPFYDKFQGDKELDWESLQGKCPRRVIGFKSGHGMEWCPAVHAEENTILNCARMGISAKDTIMYMTCGIPCSKCMVKIINTGVKELVVSKFSWYDESTKYILENSDVKVRLYDFVDKSDLFSF